MTNENKLKIKELLDHIYNLGHVSLNECGREELKRLINEVKYRHKKLKKENKKLKMEEYASDALPYMVGTAALRFSMCPPCDLPIDLQPKKYPVVEFKCAKTNKPTKNKWYWCVVSDGDELTFKWIKYLEWTFDDDVGETTLAFTETSPEDILKNLKS